MNKLVILDRDGVINHDSDAFIKSPEEWLPLPGSLAAIVALQRQGHTVAVATNQSGIARGLLTEATLARIHAKFQTALAACGGQPVTVVHCPHGPGDDCPCRKPRPGLLQRLLTHYQAPADQTWVIGDAARDLEAARRIGARPILVLTGKGARTQQQLQDWTVPVYASLAQAVDDLLTTRHD